jgi:hypothetical protein
MAKMDRKRLEVLKAKEKDGTISHMERIELDLYRDQARERPKTQVEAGAWEELEESEEGKVEKEGVLEPRPPGPEVEGKEEFEVVPADEGIEEEEEEPVAGKKASPPTRPVRAGSIEQEQARTAVAFGAGAIIGYFLRDLLEDEAEPGDEDGEKEGDDEGPGPDEGLDD